MINLHVQFIPVAVKDADAGLPNTAVILGTLPPASCENKAETNSQLGSMMKEEKLDKKTADFEKPLIFHLDSELEAVGDVKTNCYSRY